MALESRRFSVIKISISLLYLLFFSSFLGTVEIVSALNCKQAGTFTDFIGLLNNPPLGADCLETIADITLPDVVTCKLPFEKPLSASYHHLIITILTLESDQGRLSM